MNPVPQEIEYDYDQMAQDFKSAKKEALSGWLGELLISHSWVAWKKKDWGRKKRLRKKGYLDLFTPTSPASTKRSTAPTKDPLLALTSTIIRWPTKKIQLAGRASVCDGSLLGWWRHGQVGSLHHLEREELCEHGTDTNTTEAHSGKSNTQTPHF